MEEQLVEVTTADLLQQAFRVGILIFGALAVAFILFLLLRRLMLWYFKIDRIVLALETLVKQGNAQTKWNKNTWTCPECQNENPNETYTCKKCNYSLK